MLLGDVPSIMQVLQGKIDILSSNGLDAALLPGPTTPGSIKAFCPDTDPIVQYVNQQMEQYVKQMKELAEEVQHALQHISDELATEVAREQQHLMLMQDQVQRGSHAHPAMLCCIHSIRALIDPLPRPCHPYNRPGNCRVSQCTHGSCTSAQYARDVHGHGQGLTAWDASIHARCQPEGSLPSSLTVSSFADHVSV